MPHARSLQLSLDWTARRRQEERAADLARQEGDRQRAAAQAAAEARWAEARAARLASYAEELEHGRRAAPRARLAPVDAERFERRRMGGRR